MQSINLSMSDPDKMMPMMPVMPALHSRRWSNKTQKKAAVQCKHKVAQHSLHVDRHQIYFAILKVHAMGSTCGSAEDETGT